MAEILLPVFRLCSLVNVHPQEMGGEGELVNYTYAAKQSPRGPASVGELKGKRMAKKNPPSDRLMEDFSTSTNGPLAKVIL